MKFIISCRMLACGVVLIFAVGLFGCSNSISEESSDFSVQGQEDKEMDLTFSVEDYQEKIINGRIAIAECQEQYHDEIEEIQKMEQQNFNFENCKFADFPEIEELEVLVGKKHGISVQESWDTIENWLKSIGKLDEIDMKSEVRVVSPELGMDESKEYPYWYESFYEHMSDLDTGGGAFVDDNACYMMIASNGIYSMSDGKITEYLGLDSWAHLDALGNNSAEVVETGKLFELKEKRYELISGQLSVQEGADLVKDYFMAGTPFPCEEGVAVDIPEVRVFKLGDIYGYDYMVRRTYQSVPFAYQDAGYFYGDTSYNVEGDIKHAYVVDDSGVTAFTGYNEAERLITLVKENEMISLKQMINILNQKLASFLNVQVESTGLVYAPVTFPHSENPEEYIMFPCWEIAGRNEVKDENIRIYVDVFTGEIYYYTFEE